MHGANQCFRSSRKGLREVPVGWKIQKKSPKINFLSGEGNRRVFWEEDTEGNNEGKSVHCVCKRTAVGQFSCSENLV